MIAGGDFETRVYRGKQPDEFLTVEWNAKAEPNDLVVIGTYSTGEVIVQRYHGQANLGVVSVLKWYEMPGRRRWNPETISAYSAYRY